MRVLPTLITAVVLLSSAGTALAATSMWAPNTKTSGGLQVAPLVNSADDQAADDQAADDQSGNWWSLLTMELGKLFPL